ncbi:aldo/keto reductase [Candidatus Woesearchaeota archaeon]|nr:aldo/keto reductase [Candidatus Woesearchaeota archaeon]
MEYKNIGSIKLPALGLGTWEIGGRFEANYSRKQQEINLIKTAIELGFTHIDTSEVYGNGLTEEIVGEAISSFDRKKLFITSKLWHTHLNYEDAIHSLTKSLKRLKTDYLDLYFVHKPGTSMNLKQTMNAFEHLMEKKLIRNIGLSNFTKKQIEEAQRYLSKSKITALQNEYNLLSRDENALDICNKQNMVFIAYRPLMKGRLAKPGIRILDELAEKYSKTQAQIALNWVVSKPNIIAIPKASTKEHLAENLGAVGWEMERQDYEALDRIRQPFASSMKRFLKRYV